MLYNSEIVSNLKTNLNGYKIAWDAGLPFDQHEWLIGFPKLNIERKIKAIASDDLKKWIHRWKSQRCIFYACQNKKNYFSRAGIEQTFGNTTLCLTKPKYSFAGITNAHFGILRKSWQGHGQNTVLKAGNLYIILSALVNLMFRHSSEIDCVFRRT